jgi:DNA-binding transcriptional regulator GbsR (MarR family)
MADRTRGQRDEEGVRRFVEHLAMMLAEWGFPRMPARVLGSMMTADEDSLTAADLAERLGVSAAAISGAVRYLNHIGMISREPVHGSRRDRYRLPQNPWYQTSLLEAGLLKALADLADEAVTSLGSAATPSGSRVAEMRDFFRFFESELPNMLDRWRALRSAQDSELGGVPAAS